jgi:hypothetical protein
MSVGGGGFHPSGKVEVDGPDFSVRWADLDDLYRLVREATESGLSARWSSVDALTRQVEPGTTAILCPLFRNADPIGDPPSFRCHVWFVSRSEKQAAVSLFDVKRESFLALSELSRPDQLRKAVRLILDWQSLVPLE